ncbi:ATP-binding protein [Kitasatospora sp. NPDC058170]|uniref:ATP-binding protein n=1 Tax=Kitasatospora sp. NPDC058170 TaxID=3346364 RepID=UPI0036D8B383
MGFATSTTLGQFRLGDVIGERRTLLNTHVSPCSYARAMVKQVVFGWLSASQLDDAVLVATEVVANAINHAGGAEELTIRWYPSGITIAVRDARNGADIIARRASVLHDPTCLGSTDQLTEGGRGLALVDHCATAWCVELLPGGTVVTALFGPEKDVAR